MTNSQKFDDLPEIIISQILMSEPNQSIPLHIGIFELTRDSKFLKINGSVNLEWFPNKRVRFTGEVMENTFNLDDLFKLEQSYDLVINGLKTGTCHLSEVTVGDNSNFKGELDYSAVIGDKSIAVSKICFSIPNLRDFFGDPIKISKNGVGRNRMTFDTDEFLIIVDKLPKFDDLKKSLKSKGGYLFLYSGEIIKKNGAIYHEEMKDISICFSNFLSFLNGRRCSIYVAQGIYENNTIWTDFTPNRVDLYKTVRSWPCRFALEGLNEAWRKFYNILNVDKEEGFLNSIIHWYLEANCNPIIDNAIVLTQIGLELVYNWYVVEQKKILIGPDSENISAANKIRLLLSQIGLKNDLPSSFIELRNYIEQNKLPDGIEAFVQIRNALVHSQQEKRRKLDKISPTVLYQANELGLWYLELSILKIIDFNGKYQFRCSDKAWPKENEMLVPWMEK